MPFFKNSKKKIISRNDAETTILAKNTKINGHIETSENLHLDGTFEGDIDSSGLVIIGDTGNVKSNINADKIIVSGKVQGNINARIVEIMAEGTVIGNITSEEFIIEKDGVFEGESHHRINNGKSSDEKALVQNTQKEKKKK